MTEKDFDVMVISEKPRVSGKIAEAIGGSRVKKKMFHGNVYRYETEVNGKRVVVVPAVGHVFGLKQNSSGFYYPVFDLKWDRLPEVDRKAEYVKPFLDQLEEISKRAREYMVACDYDIEGQTIAYNILRYICKLSDNEIRYIPRMKFSTLTSEELRRAFQKPMPFDLNLAYAGETRAIIDWWWGINTSRALMISLRRKGINKTLSMGRVQGPTLSFIYEREEEIKRFKPTPFWKLQVKLLIRGERVTAGYEKPVIWSEGEAEKIKGESETERAVVLEVSVREAKIKPPTPFNLGDLQTEAHSKLGFTPMKTQRIAQNLYENGLISYPRTSSQKLPESIGYREILTKIFLQDKFKDLAEELLEKPYLKPNQGRKEDPAHPAIYPTGLKPRNLSLDERKLYDLIVYRFLAVFGETGRVETVTAKISLNKHLYILKGKRLIERGWIKYYPYYRVSEVILPPIKVGDEVRVVEIQIKRGETKLPQRYSPASLIKVLERNNLGTKATRALIIEKLFERKYIEGRKSIKITPLGKAVFEALNKYCRDVLSKDLTRELEEKLEAISFGKINKEDFLKEAKEKIAKIMNLLKEKEDLIGESLNEALKRQTTVKTGFRKAIEGIKKP